MSNQIMNITPPSQSVKPTNLLPGHVISTSSNVIMALSLLESYINSTYALQAADTELEAAISNQETEIVNAFEKAQNSQGGYLYELEHLNTKSKNYSAKVSQLSSEYAAASAENQAKTKVMDGNSSVAQNTLNQNAQGQQGIIQTMSSINSVGANLTRIVQG